MGGVHQDCMQMTQDAVIRVDSRTWRIHLIVQWQRNQSNFNANPPCFLIRSIRLGDHGDAGEGGYTGDHGKGEYYRIDGMGENAGKATCPRTLSPISVDWKCIRIQA